MTELYYNAFIPAFSNIGVPVAQARLYFYYTQTNTLAPIYSDFAATIPLTNPVVANLAGKFPDIYLDSTIIYRVKQTDAFGVLLGDEVDPYVPGQVFKGDPGGNTMAIGLFTGANGQSIPIGTNSVRTTGYSVNGKGIADYFFDASVNGTYVTANPRTSFISANGRGFRLAPGTITPEICGAIGDGVTDDTTAVQTAVNLRGNISLISSYMISAAVTVKGGTFIRGANNAKLVWTGPTSGNILQDSSVVVSTDINLNILLQDFEIDGGDLVSGASGQIAVNFYRTGNVTIRGLTVHGVGGSGIRWGFSQIDTKNILVENNTVYDCRVGDAIQGVGTKIVIRNNRVGLAGSTTSNFGDTAIALLADFNGTTNPSSFYSSDVIINDNTIIGNYQNGAYVGTGNAIQTGIAFGPFNVGVESNIRVFNNTLSNCYLNLWGIVMDNVAIYGNDFGAHSATATGGVRIDGITNLKIHNNRMRLAYASGGSDYSAILLVAQRNTYGASKFDADINRFNVRENTITSSVTAVGIRATFENINSSPTYTSKLTNGRIEENLFFGVTTPIVFAPQAGSTANVCSNVVVRGNMVDSSATTLFMANGNANQYVGVRLLDNPIAGIPLWAGSGVDDLLFQHKTYSKTSCPTGVATTLLALPSTGYYRVDINTSVKAANSAFSATATITVNGGTARISNQSNGANLVLTLSGLNVQGNQTTGGTNDISLTGTYS